MKKIFAMVLVMVCLLSLCGCSEKEILKIELPFELADIEKIEMYHYDDVPVSAEKKLVTDKDDVEYIYNLFQELDLKQNNTEEYSGASVTSFRFVLSDGTNYEIVYVGNGVKKGVVKSSMGDFEYFTSEDIGWCWSQLNTELVAEPAVESELPK